MGGATADNEHPEAKGDLEVLFARLRDVLQGEIMGLREVIREDTAGAIQAALEPVNERIGALQGELSVMKSSLEKIGGDVKVLNGKMTTVENRLHTVEQATRMSHLRIGRMEVQRELDRYRPYLNVDEAMPSRGSSLTETVSDDRSSLHGGNTVIHLPRQRVRRSRRGEGDRLRIVVDAQPSLTSARALLRLPHG